MTKPVWSHVLTLSAWSSYSQLPGNLSPDYKNAAYMANSSPTELSHLNHT